MKSAIARELSPEGRNRLDYLVYLVILLEGCLYWIFCRHVEDIAPDSSTYQGLAESLRNFGTYQFNFAPHIQYPPGLPLLLVAIGSVFGDEHIVYLRAMAVTGIFSLWITYEFLKREQGRALAATCTLLLGASGYYFTFTSSVLNADVPYLFASIAALLVGNELDKRNPPLRTLGLSFVLGFLLLLSVLLRSVGIALVGGFCVWLALALVRSRSISKLRLIAFGVPLASALAVEAAWMLYIQRVKTEALSAWGGAYADQFRLVDPHRPELGFASIVDILLRIPGNLVQHSGHLFELASGVAWVDQLWLSPFVLLPMTLVGWGLLDSIARRQGAVEWYFVLYAIIYSVWPFDVGARFVLPIFPIAFLYAWRAAGLLSNIASKYPRGFALAGCATGIALGAVALVMHVRAGMQSSLQARISPLLWLTAGAILGAAWFMQFRGSSIVDRGIRFLGQPLPARQAAPSIAHWIGALLVAALIVKGAIEQVGSGVEVMGRDSSTINHSASVEAARWIKAHAGESDIVMAQQLQVVHYVSGHRVVGFPATTDPKRIVEAIRNGDVKFLVVVDTSRTGSNVLPAESERLRTLRNAYRTLLELVHEGPGVQVFRIVGVAATSGMESRPLRLDSATPVADKGAFHSRTC